MYRKNPSINAATQCLQTILLLFLSFHLKNNYAHLKLITEITVLAASPAKHMTNHQNELTHTHITYFYRIATNTIKMTL